MKKLIATLPLCGLLVACGSSGEEDGVAAVEAATQKTDLVWAINVGGPAYKGIEGTQFSAEEFVTGGEPGTIDTIKGSQDPTLYETYREGDVRVEKPIANGTYDVTLHFAEPDEIAGGGRVFNASIEGEQHVEDLDVMLFRDGKVKSALTVTVPDVNVTDGTFDIGFTATAGEPILSAVVVRDKNRPAPDWKLVWSDEFDYTGAPDPEKWSARNWPPRKVNDEDQAYTDRPKNLRVEDGHLVIEAHLEDYEGAKYTSGRVHTQGKADFLYGRFEIRVKVPKGQGTWAAAWMLPENPYKYSTTCEPGEDWQGSSTCDAWPNSGEIDILEHVGFQMGHVHGTVHNEAYYWLKWEQRKGRILIDDVEEQFYTYTAEWSPERIDMYVDDVHYFTYMNEGDGWRSWPYDQSFFIILNLAIGGAWGRAGGPIDDTVFPQQMLVDYVRVYQLEELAE